MLPVKRHTREGGNNAAAAISNNTELPNCSFNFHTHKAQVHYNHKHVTDCPSVEYLNNEQHGWCHEALRAAS